jgi:NitT/TauT family transport system ATP-binding protein
MPFSNRWKAPPTAGGTDPARPTGAETWAGAPKPSALEVRIEAKRFADPSSGVERLILTDVRFDLSQGEFVAVIGPSGCGKSTLLHLVAGLDRHFDGRVHWASSAAGTQPRLGYVFQNPRLLPWLKVRANVGVGLEHPSRQLERIDTMLAAMGLAEFGHFHPKRLSVGMQRRAALARAFVIEPHLLLMDEPFVSLDAPTADQLRRLLLEVWGRQRSTVLFVTHDLREATLLADRILFLSACPATLVEEVRVGIPRAERFDEARVAERYAELRLGFDRLYGNRHRQD